MSRESGLSFHMCRSCMRKFQAAETFRSMAKSSYEKQGYNALPPPLHSPLVHGCRKRTKDTSGFEASPHTAQARPLAKRSTVAVGGRKLAFPPCENSIQKKCKNLQKYRFVLPASTACQTPLQKTQPMNSHRALLLITVQ